MTTTLNQTQQILTDTKIQATLTIFLVSTALYMSAPLLIGEPVSGGEETTLDIEDQTLDVSFSGNAEPGELDQITVTNNQDEPVQGAQILLDDQELGQTNENGVMSINLPQDQQEIEITVEYNNQTTTQEFTIDPATDTYTQTTTDQDAGDETDDEDDEDTDETDDEDADETSEEETDDEEDDAEEGEVGDGDIEEGFQLNQDPVAEETVTLQLFQNWQPVSDAEIFVDGESEGNTDENGVLQIEVPDQEEITLSTDESGINNAQYTIQGHTQDQENGDNGYDDTTGQLLDAEIQQDPDFEPAEYVEVEYTGEESTGTNIESYNWNSPDTELDENTGETITYEFTSSGEYTIELEIEDEDGETDTQQRLTNVVDAPEPGINWLQPTQSTYEDTEIETEIEVFNAVEGAEYRIIENSNTIHTDTLEEDGDTTINQQVEYSQGTQDIHFELDQAEDTFETDTKTIEFGAEQPEPEFTLDSPDGTTIETFDQQTDVEFSYTVENRGWAEQATITLEDNNADEVDSHSHSIASGETYNYEFENIPASEEGETYTWTIRTEDNEISESTSFDLEIVESDANLELVDETEQGDGEVEFDYTAQSDVEGEIEIKFYAEEQLERTRMECDGDGNLEEQTYQYDQGDKVVAFQGTILGGQELTDAQFTEVMMVEGKYSWIGEIHREDDNSVIASTESELFETTEEPEDQEEGDCIGSET